MLECFKMEDKNSSAKYDGYNSKTLGNNYDHISQKVKDKITDNGGVMDVKAEKNGGQELKGVRAVFNSKETRDDFNAEIDKMKKQEKNTKKQSDKKEDDAPKAKTQAELDKENKSKKLNETRINEIITESINSYLSEALKSDKLRRLSKQHGGLGDKFSRHGKSDNWAFTRGGYQDVPLSDITDDMLSDESELDTNEYSNKSSNGVVFQDGSTLPFKDKESALEISDKLQDKQRKRRLSKGNDGSEEYIPSTNSSYHARHVRDVMKHGRNTIKTGLERSKEFGDRNIPKYWRDYIQNGKDVVNNAKQTYQDFKKDGTFNDKTKRF